MPEFSPNDYFLKEFQKSLNQVNGVTVADTKYFDLVQARNKKLAEFGARVEAAYQADLAQGQELNTVRKEFQKMAASPHAGRRKMIQNEFGGDKENTIQRWIDYKQW